MIDDSKRCGNSRPDDTDYDLITNTRFVSCAVGNQNSTPKRLSLRARLEREREQRRQLRRVSLFANLRNLFS